MKREEKDEVAPLLRIEARKKTKANQKVAKESYNA
jgi:hypothetical protein